MRNETRSTSKGADRSKQTCFKWLSFLSSLVVMLTGCVLWLIFARSTDPVLPTGVILESARNGRNIVREAFPNVDFAPLYPGMTDDEIDQLQRETFAVRYAYSPFVQFQGLPMQARFVTITPDGRRLPDHSQPWPPREQDVSVFVFGGSTIFGNNLPPGQTVPVALEHELRKRFRSADIHVYNFGCGYYYSTQERVLFDQLLTRGHIPDLAIFIDGLNDFLTPSGAPKFTSLFTRYTLPETNLPAEAEYETDEARLLAVRNLLQRYRLNIRLTETSAAAFGVKTLFVGQPVPFHDYPQDAVTYPFRIQRKLDALCRWGYPQFASLAAEGAFGRRFIWTGDAFRDAETSMYSDSIHYSPAGARLLARRILDQAVENGLLDLDHPLLRKAPARVPGS